MITVPSGNVGLDFLKGNDPVSGNRRQWFTYELEGNEGAPKGALSGVTGGRIEWHSNAAVHAGGKIVVQAPGRTVNWLSRRVKIYMHIEGKGSYPLGVFIPSAPSESWDDMNLTLDIELLDKCSVLDNDYVAKAYSLDAGAVVTDVVRNLIVGTGEKAGSITKSAKAIKSPMTWDAGTSKLQIINDVLAAGDFFSLQADGNGAFRVHRQNEPLERALTHDFYDDYQSIYTPVFTYEKDIYSVPNKVILVSEGTGDEEGMVATATNENPKSPYSYQARGRWITDVVRGVDATDQDALQNKAKRRLRQLTSPTGSISIDHAPLPWLGPNDLVRFRRRTSDIDVYAVVLSTAIELNPLALSRTQLQEVVAL